MPTAILIDGVFFLKRFSRCYPSKDPRDPVVVAKTAFELALSHLEDKEGKRQLYRIFFYDCPPLQKKVHKPISRKSFDFGLSDAAIFRLKLHDELRCKRKVALRLGHVSTLGEWELKPDKLKALLAGKSQVSDLTDDDFSYSFRQKGVDMKIGLDIASLAFKHQVDQIVLVAGDADFVPAAKHARREGMDFILDPMWNPVPTNLHEHIDGLRSTTPRPVTQQSATLDQQNSAGNGTY
jgi:uncharacterized LabA/DUF88 family protein